MISLNLVLWDEFGVAERCIKSVLPYIDEIVMMNHEEIRVPDRILNYADVIIEDNLEGKVVEQYRNRLIEASSSDWILCFDPDEWACRELGENLQNLTKIGDMTEIDGFYLKRFNIVYDNEYNLMFGDDYPDWNLRLYRNTARYSGDIYEDSLTMGRIKPALGLSKVDYCYHGIHYHDKTYEDIQEVIRTNKLYDKWSSKLPPS